jgi:hypothetical protein
VKKEGSLEVALPAGTPLFRFADHEDCSQTLQKIGFANFKSADHVLTWTLPAADAFFDSFKRATARTSGLLSAQEPSAIPAIRMAITKACMPYVVEGGKLEVPMPCCLTTAQKPA